jgi:hypothetical protein
MKKTTVIIITLFAMSAKAQTKAQTSMNMLNPSENGAIPIKLTDGGKYSNEEIYFYSLKYKHDSLLIEFNKLKNFANSCIDLLNDMPAYYKENSCYWHNFKTQIELIGLKSHKVTVKSYEPCKN